MFTIFLTSIISFALASAVRFDRAIKKHEDLLHKKPDLLDENKWMQP